MPGKRMRNVSVASSTSNSISDEESIDHFSNDYGLGDSAGSSNGSSNGSSIGSEKNAPRKGRRISSLPCPSRNAALARVNRQKKKEYVNNLEYNLSHSENKNRTLNNVIAQQKIDLKRLTAEVSYLKNILNNNSSITSLLKSMNQVLGKKNNSSNNNNNNIINNNIKSEPASCIEAKGNMVLNNTTLPLFDKSDKDYILTPANIFDVEGISDPSDTGLSQFKEEDDIYSTKSMDIGFDIEDNDLNNQGSLLETDFFDNLDSTDLCWVWLDRIRTLMLDGNL